MHRDLIPPTAIKMRQLDKNEEHIYSTYISYKIGIFKHLFFCFKIDTIQKNLSQQYIDKGMILQPEYVD